MEKSLCQTSLKTIFPSLWERNELLYEIRRSSSLSSVFESWTDEQQTEFLDFCTGVRGIKLLYDSFFKEIMNPESTPERLEDFLSLVLDTRVKILTVLPNDSTRIADESSLLITDIVVELADSSIANLEIQKIGYKFPGSRSACYSSDLLLRQYKRVRSQKKKQFSYKDIRSVYTIILFEHSPAEFHHFPSVYLHRFQHQSDTGLEIDLLQKYIFIPLDIFKKIQHNKPIRGKLEAWLTFLSSDDPAMILQLIQDYPEFNPMYEQAYAMCRNIGGVMGLFSEELRELDRNTVQLMIDEMQETIDRQKKELEQLSKADSERQNQLDAALIKIAELEAQLKK